MSHVGFVDFKCLQCNIITQLQLYKRICSKEGWRSAQLALHKTLCAVCCVLVSAFLLAFKVTT